MTISYQAQELERSAFPKRNGAQVNAGSFAPITGIQFGANRVIETALNTAGYEATGLSRVAVATGMWATIVSFQHLTRLTPTAA